ncbi:NUDIX domain-containing protein [Amnibacterium sp.]|uniref:NUDIX domain-containing protein n=1 Tax=Amnibacterium sp. TaxID=1872496 RepID=UPI003F7B63F3
MSRSRTITDPRSKEAGARLSAGLLVVRRAPQLEVLIGHMGGPFWARKDAAAWSFPKGAVEGDEQPLDAALREFQEETGIAPPPPPYRDLGTERQRSGKTVRLYTVEAEVDVDAFRPGTFTMTVRGRTVEVPELDRLRWASPAEARDLLVVGQRPFLDRLERVLRPPRASG